MKLEKTKKYWFYILPHVYYAKKGLIAILLNTKNSSSIHISDKKFINLLETMHKKTNLGVALLNKNQLKDEQIMDFVKECVEKEICKVLEVNDNNQTPIQLMPILNLQRDVDKLRKDKSRSLGEDVRRYISDVTVILNDNCKQNCKYCKKYNSQHFCCISNKQTEVLKIENFINFSNQLMSVPIRRFVITGGNIFEYPFLKELIEFLDTKQINPCIGFHYLNFDLTKLEFVQNIKTEIFINFPLNQSKLELCFEHMKIENTQFVFFVKNEEENICVETILGQTKISNYKVVPFYTGNNYSFFEDYVFLGKTDLLDYNFEQRIIFANQKMNTNFFGSLYIYPNGDIKANPNTKKLGNIERTPLIKLAEKELTINSAWRKIRKTEPCNSCIYQFLCPSTSNYEIAFGKYNLCHYNPYIAKWQGEEGYVPVEDCGTYTKEKGFVVNKRKVSKLNKEIWGEE